VKPEATTGVEVKKGVFASVDGWFRPRFGQVDRDGPYIKLTWMDDGSESRYTEVDELTSVVASRTDLIEDYSHIRALGEALSEAKVKQISLADTKFSSSTLTEFVQSVRWETAAVADLNISMNPIGVDGAKALGDVISGSSLKCLIIGPKSTRLPVNDGEVTELNFEGQGFGAVEVTLVAAATSTLAVVTSLNVSHNKFVFESIDNGASVSVNGRSGRATGPPHGDSEIKIIWDDDGSTSGYTKVDSVSFSPQVDAFQQLCEALKLGQVTEVDLSACGIGPVAVGHVSDWVREATAAVARLSLSGNMITGSTNVRSSGAKFDNDLSGFEALCEAAAAVVQLTLRGCGLGDAAIPVLVPLISSRVSVLSSLDISNNSLGRRSAQLLMQAIESDGCALVACKLDGSGIDGGLQANIETLLDGNARHDPYESCKDLLDKARRGDWDQVDLILTNDAGLLAKKVPGQGLVLDQIRGLLAEAPSKVLETVLACCPSVWTSQESATFADTLRGTGSALTSADPWKGPSASQFGETDIVALAQMARKKQIPCLIWSHLGLGNDGARRLLRELTSVSPTCVTSLDLRHNGLTELPLELARLDHLDTLEIDAGNPGLGTAAQILDTAGVQDLFEYVRELHDDPRPSYSLKVVLAGPSMAGKSSLFNALRLREARLTDPEHGRTIGLDIEKIELYDPRAGKHAVIFLVYDAGGHDEYQEMHQSFLSDHTLYLLIWNVALPNDAEMQETQAAWASLIQTCAPGSTVLLVASHADEVQDADAADVVARRCQEMASAIHVLLDHHRQAQRAELDRLVAIPSLDADSTDRKSQLERILESPLRLADDVVVVSANTMVGVDTLRRRMLDEAFDKSQFPSFGESQPHTYELVLRELRRCHADQTSVSWTEMQESLSRRPDVDGQQFEVQLIKSQEVGNAAMSVRRLHAALDAAKSAQYDSLEEILLHGEPLPTSLLNSVPPPRDYGILHQLAYHGATDKYLFLVENGVEFDPELRTTRDGSTAAEIAQARNHLKFATTLLPTSLDDSLAGFASTMPCQLDGKGPFVEDLRVELSAAGVLTLHVSRLDKRSIDLSESDATLMIPKVSKRPFCLQVNHICTRRKICLVKGSLVHPTSTGRLTEPCGTATST